MRYDTRYGQRSSFSLPGFPAGVKWLIIANIAIYLLDLLLWMYTGREIGPFKFLYLDPRAVVGEFAIWQLVTYMFFHSLSSPWHIIMNLLGLWMFGTPVEQTWGTRRFLRYYFLCGIGGGICQVLVSTVFGAGNHLVLGASGAIYGLLLAFGMLFPNQEVVLFVFPIKAKYLVMLLGAVALLGSLQGEGGVSNLAHLGGMLFGYIYIRTAFAPKRRSAGGGNGSSGFDPAGLWRNYKVQRNKKKFQVYMRKHEQRNSPPDWKN